MLVCARPVLGLLWDRASSSDCGWAGLDSKLHANKQFTNKKPADLLHCRATAWPATAATTTDAADRPPRRRRRRRLTEVIEAPTGGTRLERLSVCGVGDLADWEGQGQRMALAGASAW